MSDIVLSETSAPRELDATRTEWMALRRARHGITVEEIGETPDGAVRLRVGPRVGYVGSVVLPGGRRVVVQPKAQVDHLPDLLALAYRTIAPPPRAGSAAIDVSAPTEWLLLQLAGEIHELIARGLRRGYVDRREPLPYVRGRTRPIVNPAQLPLLDCEFSDFVADTPENRLLRGTLELLSPAIKHQHIRRQFDDALAYFSQVAPLRPSVTMFDRIRLSRLTSYYEPSLRLARLALEGAGAVDSAGVLRAPAYFVLMWKVWENAVAAALRDAGVSRLLEQPTWVDRFNQVSGDPKLSVGIEPDLVIGSRSSPRLVIDLKWAPVRVQGRHGQARYRNAHLYQISTYASALSCDGLLLYPLMDDPVHSTYEFNGRRISLRTVDLSKPNLADLTAIAAEIADSVEANS